MAAAIVAAIVKSIFPENTANGKITGLLCRILVVVTVVMPLRDIRFSSISNYFNSLSEDAALYVSEGKTMAENYALDIIKEQTEAYILDKANRMGLELSVEVELDGNNGNIPCGVVIKGSASPYAKEVLGTYIEDNLGISKENQDWN